MKAYQFGDVIATFDPQDVVRVFQVVVPFALRDQGAKDAIDGSYILWFDRGLKNVDIH